MAAAAATPPGYPQTTHTLKCPIRRAALACIQCRARKVKCDATLPHCIRCQSDGKACEFQQSRRGGKRRPATVTPLQGTVGEVPAPVEQQRTSSSSDILGTTKDCCSPGCGSSGTDSAGSSIQSVTDNLDSASYLSNTSSGGTYLTQIQIDQLLSSYYIYFHVAHPCVLPKWALDVRLASEPMIATVLLPVLLYIGSIFTNAVESAPLALAARNAVTRAQSYPGPPHPYYLQAQLLYAIAVYASDEPERARGLLSEVTNDALSVGMHDVNFASHHGQGDPVLEESWRRTWCTFYHVQIQDDTLKRQMERRDDLHNRRTCCRKHTYLSNTDRSREDHGRTTLRRAMV
jgi:hypothetical protein